MGLIQRVVAAEAAQQVAQCGQALARLPSDVLKSLEDYIKASGLTSRTAKLRALALTDNLKRLSRSQPRGGINPYRDPSALTASPAALTDPSTSRYPQRAAALAASVGEQDAWMLNAYVPPGPESLCKRDAMYSRSGRLKIRAQGELEQMLAVSGPAALSLPELHQIMGLPQPLETALSPHLAAAREATPAYTHTECHAYTLSRLAGCFAAARHVMGELGVRLPEFQPQLMLDYGAGPGTAAWAAQEVWWRSLTFVHAVEPSLHMRALGRQLEVGRRFAFPAAPLVSWHPKWPARAKRRGYDLVVASYVLTEVGGALERQRLVRKLWDLTKDVLVLVEPGTPLGSANIQEARSLLLTREQRRTAKLAKRLEQLGGTDRNLQVKASRLGAHVVAPCPHDGVCPLIGSTSWCHFATRFHRPGFMQAAKAPHGSRSSAYDHQDERFSYLVLRRGPRPAAAPDIGIARTLNALEESGEESLPHLTDSVSSEGLEDTEALLGLPADLFDAMGQDSSTGRSSSSSKSGEQQQERQQQEQQGQELLQGVGGSLGGVVGVGHSEWGHRGKQGSVDVRRLEGGDAGGLPLQTERAPAAQDGLGAPAAADEDLAGSSQAAGQVDSHLSSVNERLGPYGAGLVDRLVALEEAGVDWAQGGALSWEVAAATSDAATQAAPLAEGHVVMAPSSSKASSSSSSQRLDSGSAPFQASSSSSSSGVLSPDPAAVAEAAAASVRWSRIIRPPRKRAGHVILDLCMPVAAEDEQTSTGGARGVDGKGPQGHGRSRRRQQGVASQAALGRLERHVVARSDGQKWMGSAGYGLARSSKWGDLWPSFYNLNPKRQVLRTAAEMQNGAEGAALSDEEGEQMEGRQS